MTDDRLSSFLSLAKERGVPDESRVAMLRQTGWPERRIDRALSEYYAGTLGAAVPVRDQGSGNARDAFLYLLNFITLGFWSVALWQIWDDLVKRWFPIRFRRGLKVSRDDIAWQGL